MSRALTAIACMVALAVGSVLVPPAGAASGAPPADPEVVKGIAEVDSGEYDAAILRLDGATRRLAAEAGPRDDLVQAYVYLAVAYLAKGHETSAKNHFRDALARDGALRLSPDKFSPRVVELFEKARDEMRPSPPASPAPAAVANKGGGGKKTLVIVGLGGAAAAAAAVALAGGGGAAAAPSAPSGLGVVLQQGFSGLIPGANQFFDVVVRTAGTLQVTLDWGAPGHDLDVYLATPACTNTAAYPPDVCSILARAETPSTKPETFRAPVTTGTYRIVVAWCGAPACGTGTEAGTVLAVLEP